MANKRSIKEHLIPLRRYSNTEIGLLKKVMEEVNQSITSDMFHESSYLPWSIMYKKSQLPFHNMSHKMNYEDSKGRSGMFSGRNAFVFGMEMPLTQVPRYIHTPVPELKAIVEWRLKIGK